MLYSMSDNRQVNVPTEVGGCGVAHEVAMDSKGRKYIDCAAGCEAWLTKVPSLGWSNHPGGVRQTPDEIAQTERDEREAKRVGAAHLVEQLMGRSGLAASPAEGPSLLELFARLTPQERGAFLAMAGVTVPPAVDAAPSVPTVDSTATEPDDRADETLAAPKSRGGRPRKATAAAAA